MCFSTILLFILCMPSSLFLIFPFKWATFHQKEFFSCKNKHLKKHQEYMLKILSCHKHPTICDQKVINQSPQLLEAQKAKKKKKKKTLVKSPRNVFRRNTSKNYCSSSLSEWCSNKIIRAALPPPQLTPVASLALKDSATTLIPWQAYLEEDCNPTTIKLKSTSNLQVNRKVQTFGQ